MDKLYAHFRSYWPSKKAAPCQEDAYMTDEALPAECSEGGGEAQAPNDLELARALGVPDDCVQRLSPQKVTPGKEADVLMTCAPPDRKGQDLDLRIQTLKFLG